VGGLTAWVWTGGGGWVGVLLVMLHAKLMASTMLSQMKSLNRLKFITILSRFTEFGIYGATMPA
jgi:hypothetical protein